MLFPFREHVHNFLRKVTNLKIAGIELVRESISEIRLEFERWDAFTFEAFRADGRQLSLRFSYLHATKRREIVKIKS